jgi:acyl dehydratase
MSGNNCPLHWEDVQIGAPIPAISLAVTYEKVVMTPMATWDLFPGHSDPFYAIGQGQPTIYLNTIALQGFCDRVLTDWAGYSTLITRRKMRMLGSVFAGDLLTGHGEVVNVYRDARGNRKIDVAITLTTPLGVACTAETSAILPGRPIDCQYP